MPLFGPPNVDKLREKGNLGGLIAALGYGKDPNVRKKAADRIGSLWTEVTEPLRKFIRPEFEQLGLQKPPEWEIQWNSLVAAFAPAVRALCATLRDPDNWVRLAAVYSLGEIGSGGPQSVEPLCGALKDEHPGVRRAAASALGDIHDEKAVGPLMATLTDEHEEQQVRETASDAVIKIVAFPIVEPSAIVKLLITALKNPAVLVRKTAVRGLGRISDPRTVEPLVECLTDIEPDVRLAAIHGLGWKGDPRAIVPLRAALKNSDEQVGRDIAQALSTAGDSEHLVAYMRKDLRESKDIDVLEKTIDRLQHMGPAAEAAAPELAAILSGRINVWPQGQKPTHKNDYVSPVPETGEGYMGNVDWNRTSLASRRADIGHKARFALEAIRGQGARDALWEELEWLTQTELGKPLDDVPAALNAMGVETSGPITKTVSLVCWVLKNLRDERLPPS